MTREEANRAYNNRELVFYKNEAHRIIYVGQSWEQSPMVKLQSMNDRAIVMAPLEAITMVWI